MAGSSVAAAGESAATSFSSSRVANFSFRAAAPRGPALTLGLAMILPEISKRALALITVVKFWLDSLALGSRPRDGFFNCNTVSITVPRGYFGRC